MNITICDICGETIRVSGHELTFTKRNAIFNDIEHRYDVCDKCFNKMIALWNKNRANISVVVSK